MTYRFRGSGCQDRAIAADRVPEIIDDLSYVRLWNQMLMQDPKTFPEGHVQWNEVLQIFQFCDLLGILDTLGDLF
jgi:hypothetical protein